MSIQHEDAAQIHKFAFVGTSDPGAVGQSKCWIDTSTINVRLKVRDAPNTGWFELGISNQSVFDFGNLTPTANDILQYKSGAWANRTISQVKSDLSLNNVPNVNAVARGNHTGTQLASTISDFNSSVDSRVATAITAEGFGELAYQDKATVDITGGTVFTDAEGLGLGSLGTKNLIFKADENLATNDRVISFIVGDDNRTLNLSGDLVVDTSGATVAGTNTGNETTQTIGDLLVSATQKAVPVDDDEFALGDSTALNIIRYLTYADLKKNIKSSDVVTESNQSTTMAVTRLGKTVRYTHSGALDSTIPGTGTLGTNFMCKLFNDGDSNLTIIAGGGVTLYGNTTLAVHKICTIEAITTNTYKISGENT